MAFFESPNVVKNVVNGVCIAAKVLGVGLSIAVSMCYGDILGWISIDLIQINKAYVCKKKNHLYQR